MKPKKAAQHLELIIDTQDTVSINRIKKMVEVIISHNNRLEKDNRRLRRRIKNLRSDSNE